MKENLQIKTDCQLIQKKGPKPKCVHCIAAFVLLCSNVDGT